MTGQVGITSWKWEKSVNESKWWEDSWNYKKKGWKTNKVECLQKYSVRWHKSEITVTQE